jgi:hypothetical protein
VVKVDVQPVIDLVCLPFGERPTSLHNLFALVFDDLNEVLCFGHLFLPRIKLSILAISA